MKKYRGRGGHELNQHTGTMEGRSTREDPIPREGDLTAEDWVVMDAVERCPVWRALKAFNFTQESVEGNDERPTIHGVEKFRDWGRRWGQDDPEAQLLLQHQWDNLLRHVMGITAAMEVWEPSTASSSGETASAMDLPLLSTGGELTNPEANAHLGEEERPHNATNALMRDYQQTEGKKHLSNAMQSENNMQLAMSERE